MKIRLFVLALLGVMAAAFAEPLSGPVLERYEQMLLRAPEPGAAFEKVYQHYLEGEGLDALAARWTAASEQAGAPKADYLLLLGLLNDRRGKTDDALKILHAAAEAGGTWRAWSALAAAEARAGKLNAAVASGKKAIALDPPADVAPKLYRGLALCQQRLMDNDGAVATWQAYAKATPGDAFALEEAGDALLEAGRYNEARDLYIQLRGVKDIDPAKKLNASLKLAEVERQRGDKAEALKIYQAALAESGGASWLQREVRSRIERLFRSDDDLPGLAKYYQERLAAEPGDLDAGLRLSEVLVDLNRNEEALKVLETASGKAPDNKDVQLRFAAALLHAERPADAEKTLTVLARNFPDDTAIVEQLGNAQWQAFKLGKGEKEAALATWRKLAPDGADAGARQRLADIFRAHDLPGEAVAEYRLALAADPAANDRRERLADYLMELDRKDEALQELQGMVAGGLANGENYLRLAKLQRRFGDTAAAKKSLEAGAQFPDRAFERQLLAWQIASEEKAWPEAEAIASAMRLSAQTDPEIERADDSLAESLRALDKTNAEIGRLLDRARQSPDQFTERDFRLLEVLAIAAEDNGSAQFALMEGLRRFPKSALLARLDHAYARRIGDQARRLAALERLEQVEPQRAGDWMAERVRAYRDAGRDEDAVNLARQCVQLSPAKPEAHILLADTLLAAEKPDEAVKALQEAIRLADKPNQIRFRLADLYLAQGRYGAARGVLEEAFEAEESPAAKLQLTNRLASVYLQDGKIDDLITKMRERQKAEQGGWRYALYLSEIYLVMQDTVHALEELDKALAGKPDDPILLKKLYNLAEMNADTESALRYARKLADVEPSKQNRAELGEALARDGKLDEATELIKDNSAEFLADPDAWQETVRLLQVDDRAGGLAALLEGKLRADPGDWRSLMALAEILAGAGQGDRAAAIFWQVLAAKEDPSAAAAQPSPTPPPVTTPAPGRPILLRRGGIAYAQGIISPAQSRQIRFSETYQRVMQTLSNNQDNLRFSRRLRYPFGGAQGAISNNTLAEAQDEAMVYLACLAMRDGIDADFLRKLAEALRERSVEDRLTIYSFLQAPDAAAEEIRRFLASGSKDVGIANAAYQALQMLVSNRQNNRQISVGAMSDEEAKDLMSRLGDIILAGSGDDPYQRYQLLSMLGRREEAEKLVDRIINDADPNDSTALGMGMQLALSRRNFDKALELHGKLEALQRKNPGNPQPGLNFNLALQLINSDSHRRQGIDLLADEFAAPGGTGTNMAVLYGGYGRQVVAWQQLRGNLAQAMPFPTADLDRQQAGFLRNVAAQNPLLQKALPEVIARFDKLAEERNSASLRQAGIWLRWFSGQEKEAIEGMKRLTAQSPADDLLLNYSLMLLQDKKPREALNVLGQMQANSGDAYDLSARLRVVIAQQLKDNELARQAVLKLATIRLADYEIPELAQLMRTLDLKAEASQLEKKSASLRQPRQRSRQMFEVMRERMEAGHREEALALAYAMLARDPFSRAVRDERYQQQSALQVLDKFGELKGYIARLEEQLKAAPQSARLNAQLAQALQLKDSRDALPYYRALAELRPKDTEWQRQLGSLLVQANLDEEAMKLYDRLLAERPEVLLAEGTNFLEPYRRSKNWPRLVSAIVHSPDPKSDPMNPYRQNFSGIFAQIGREAQRARPPIDPTDLWIKGLRWDESGGVALRPSLAQSLMRAGREAEARQVLEEAFFPPGRDDGSARLFVFNRQARPNSLWGQSGFNGRGDLESPALNLMRTAAALGFLDDFLPRFQKLPVSPDGTNPYLLARIVARDEKVLPEIAQIVAKAGEAKAGAPLPANVNLNMLRVFAGELAEWPEAHETAYQALEAAARLATINGNDYGTQMNIEWRRANLALEDGRRETAQAALKNWVKASKDWKRQGSQIDGQQGLKMLKLMAAANLPAEAKELTETLRGDPNFARNSYYQRLLRQTENEIAFVLGKETQAVAAVAWVPGADGGRILWDMRGAGGIDRNDRTIWMNEQALGSLGGSYTLEVYFGEDETSMRRLFSKTGAPARGSWTGRLPGDRGYLRAVLRKGEEMNFGPVVFVAAGNLLFSPENLKQVPGVRGGTAGNWALIPAAPASFEKGGPTGHGYLRLEGDRQNEMELIGGRVPVKSSKNYQMGGWFRYRENEGNARLGWRFFDAKGKELQNSSAGGNFRGDRWNYAVQNFGQGDNFSGIPDDAAWLELYITGTGRVDLQDVFVLEFSREDQDQ